MQTIPPRKVADHSASAPLAAFSATSASSDERSASDASDLADATTPDELDRTIEHDRGDKVEDKANDQSTSNDEDARGWRKKRKAKKESKRKAKKAASAPKAPVDPNILPHEKYNNIITEEEIEALSSPKEKKRAKAKRKRQIERKKQFDKAYAAYMKKNPSANPIEAERIVDEKVTAKRKKKKRHIGPIIFMLFGVMLLAVPIVSDMYASWVASQAISSYTHTASKFTQEEIEDMIAEAVAYNHRLMPDARPEDKDINDIKYMDILNVTKTGIMGSIEIECIGVNQPIYHTVDDNVLMNGVGHMEGTSFPLATGGSWAAIAGHTGMPGQRMFDELVSLEGGEIVKVKILDRTTIYRVDGHKVVEPDWQGVFDVTPGVDEMTLITCTPYGINDHRLLIHCTAVPEDEIEEVENTPIENKLSKFLNMRTLPIIATFVIVIISSLNALRRKLKKKRAAEKVVGATEKQSKDKKQKRQKRRGKPKQKAQSKQ